LYTPQMDRFLLLLLLGVVLWQRCDDDMAD